ncbi:MAG: hypothetical protein KatS3mg062_0278 [Tepidiforma sp.]|nr:MAG: hypothetical protein KatS3mg062_0278 [Tepidiforma sp.]
MLPCFSLVLLGAAAFSGCRGGSDAGPTGTGNDEDYLRTVCTGVDRVTDALMSATTPDAIAAVIEEFAATMRAIDPPPDLAEYNQRFVAYLEAAVKDPTSVVTTTPPLPPDDARRRLAALEPSITECREPTFFSRGLE